MKPGETQFKSEFNKTGIPGLDDIFKGGIQKGNTIVIEGTPGTGKTTFAFQFMLAGLIEHEPAVFITFEQDPIKLKRDALSFGWDLAYYEDQGLLKIIHTDPSVLLADLQNSDSIFNREITTHNTKRLVVDGLTPLRLQEELSEPNIPYRHSLQLLFDSLRGFQIAVLLTNEIMQTPELGQSTMSHEQFLCDTVITLRQEATRIKNTSRTIEIAKSRGQDFYTGRHTIRFESNRGLVAYKRAQSPEALNEDQPVSTDLVSIGCPDIDTMLGGGLYRGSASLVVGISGTGKTVLAVQALTAAAERGENCLLVTLDEHVEQIVRNASGLGFPIEKYLKSGQLHCMYDSPMELELDVHFSKIAEAIDKYKIDLAVIDSISAYQSFMSGSPHEFVYALTTFLKNKSVTVIMNYENPELIGISQISKEFKVSPIVDNIILLNYVETGNRLRRAITVPKARGLAPSRETCEYLIQHGGIKIITDFEHEETAVPQLPFSAYYGILGRSPMRRSPFHHMENLSPKQKSTIRDLVDG